MSNTCTTIILHPNHLNIQAAGGQLGDVNYDAWPISSFNLKDGILQGDEPTRKRRRRTYPHNIDEIIQKDFSLYDLYKCNKVEEIKLDKEKGETVLDAAELLKNLKGWTIEITKREEKPGKNSRVDKMYQHPRSAKKLRSVAAVKKFILEQSCLTKASENGDGSIQGAKPSDDGSSVNITESEDSMKTP